ncbi:translation factor Guf1, mitochondrial-like [Lineus longissimus]|uniref:translation factor Guf1, mitochondrial-like n=1 Tax=Lineus longissimus TaxID=88925 RepID=UPI002B4FB33E
MLLFHKICRIAQIKQVVKFKRLFSTHRYLLAAKTPDVFQKKKSPYDLKDFPPERIRNFSIIAHVDHGKSTLADRLLEITGTITANKSNAQVLDKLQVERERGITVKAQSATLFHKYKGEMYMLNLIDTPGHVDFNYEVSRSLSACQGVLLLVDANQGVQAQTVANFYLAFEADLAIVPVMNKIDLPGAQPDVVALQLQNLFDMEPNDTLKVSAKQGLGVEDVLTAVIERIPPPLEAREDQPLKALLFDSDFDKFKGAVVSVAVKSGTIQKGDKIVAAHSKKAYEVQELGILYPDIVPTGVLYAGQCGYMVAGMKTPAEAQIGDTLYHQASPVEALPGFKPARAMVFAGVFPMDQAEFPSLRNALEKLTLNDNSVTVYSDTSPALGQGWRLGFLGLLHMDVFNQRLEQEYDASVIMTSPNVPYKVKVTGPKNIKKYGGDEITILNPCLLPDPAIITEFKEPMVNGTIILPDRYVGDVIKLCLDRRGVIKDQTYIDDNRVLFRAVLPLNEIIVNFFDELKSVTSGYASFDYEDHGYQLSPLVKLDIKLNGKPVDELTMIAHANKARKLGQRVVNKLAETIPRQLYEVIIQAAIGNKILCRATLKALKKDVLAKCYGGDITRKMKLLRRQAEGKKRMRKIGNVEVPKDTFINVLKR